MKGFEKGSKEYNAIKEYLMTVRKLKREIHPKDMDIKKVEILTELLTNYSKGFIGAEMQRIDSIEFPQVN